MRSSVLLLVDLVSLAPWRWWELSQDVDVDERMSLETDGTFARHNHKSINGCYLLRAWYCELISMISLQQCDIL